MKKLFLSSLCFMVSLTTVAQTWNFGFGGGYLHNHFSMKRLQTFIWLCFFVRFGILTERRHY